MIQGIVDFLIEFGIWGLFIHAFIDAIFFPIPAFFTQVSLSLVSPSAALWLATAGFIACLLGTPFGYLIGKLLGNSVLEKLLKKEWVESATHMFQKNGETAILIGAFTPIPFKVFTILSGCLKFPLWRLLAYAAIGRAAKFYVVGTLFYVYGRMAESMVKDVSLYMFLIAVPIIVLILFIKKKYQKKSLASPEQAAGEDTDQSTTKQAIEPIKQGASKVNPID